MTDALEKMMSDWHEINKAQIELEKAAKDKSLPSWARRLSAWAASLARKAKNDIADIHNGENHD